VGFGWLRRLEFGDDCLEKLSKVFLLVGVQVGERFIIAEVLEFQL
jgi:hypothetical protein